ncbi:MAG TPA: response regulator [Syntrophales bacterium]|nr:response regulator [Syntrophales bacterium]HOL60194.1 response regulator [Syntrophales bacterium]
MTNEGILLSRENPYQKKILVVDDYPPTREMIVEALAACGYENVHEAENGLQALEMLRREPHHLVISDVMMPHMDGIDLLQHVREMKTRPVVIMITAQPEIDLTVKAMKKGAVDYLKKPFKIDELIYRVDLYLKGQEFTEMGEEFSEREEELSVHSYIFDSVETIEGENDLIFEKIVDLALKVVEGEACQLFLYDREEDAFYPKMVKPEEEQTAIVENLSLIEKMLHKALDRGEAIIATSEDNPLFSPAIICAPLTIRGNPFGVLVVRRKKTFGSFTKKDLHYVVSLTKRASLNIENRLLYESLFNNVYETFKSLVASVQLRDQYTEQHSLRVTEMAVKIARHMGLEEEDLEVLRLAGPLHDIGKIAIPDAILLKPDRLTADEYEVIKTHSQLGEKILTPISLFDREKAIVRYHHERWDGKGYPDGLKGEEIPLLARVLAVADTYDAITNDRPYQRARSHAEAIEEIYRQGGKQFDPQVVEHLVAIQ